MTEKPARMSLFKPVYLDQRVALTPMDYRKAADDIDAFLVEKLRERLEGKCCTHGWVRPGSTQILARSMGQAEHGRFTADFLYTCKVRVLCYEPTANQQVEARVLMANKLGAYVLLVDQGRVREAARILLPRDYHEGNAEFDTLQPGQGVKIRILSFRFQANDGFINAVGVYEGRAPGADQKAEGAEGGAPALVPPIAPTEGAAAAATA
jgi:DNA-directed RNA polymerase subunit E'/Rpb7